MGVPGGGVGARTPQAQVEQRWRFTCRSWHQVSSRLHDARRRPRILGARQERAQVTLSALEEPAHRTRTPAPTACEGGGGGTTTCSGVGEQRSRARSSPTDGERENVMCADRCTCVYVQACVRACVRACETGNGCVRAGAACVLTRVSGATDGSMRGPVAALINRWGLRLPGAHRCLTLSSPRLPHLNQPSHSHSHSLDHTRDSPSPLFQVVHAPRHSSEERPPAVSGNRGQVRRIAALTSLSSLPSPSAPLPDPLTENFPSSCQD